MDAVIRAGIVYLAIMVLFRISGKRTLAQITTFDFVLLLVIGEATQQALLGEDYSITNAILVVATLLGADMAIAAIQRVVPRAGRYVEGLPLVVIENGEVIDRHMEWARIDVDDVLEEARTQQGLERLDQIKHAVLERNGAISVVPKSSG